MHYCFKKAILLYCLTFDSMISGFSAPPVGSYNIPDQKSIKSTGFDKAARWLGNT